MNADSRYDAAIAHRLWVNRHLHECRSDECPFCESTAEDAKWEREGISA